MEYSLYDFLLFSPEVYWRMVENFAVDFIWLATIVNLVLFGALTAFKHKYVSNILFWTLAICWVWLGWRFYIIEYGSINWFARYIGAFCLLLTPIFITLAIRTKAQFDAIELALLSSTIVYIVFVRPLLLKVLGHGWQPSGVGLLPVPTILVSLGLLLSIKFSYRWLVVTLLSMVLLTEVVTLFMVQDSMWQEGPVILAALLMIAYSGKYRILSYTKQS